jgi:pimeloyl-ACP methyl ester carboxylesterase
MSTITTTDETQIYYKDCGTGQPVVFSHGWPLSSDAWDGQLLFLAQHGYRVIAHDRRPTGAQAKPRPTTIWMATCVSARSSCRNRELCCALCLGRRGQRRHHGP